MAGTQELNLENTALIYVNPENIEKEHICCAIGNDKTNKSRSEQKKEWLKLRFNQGHRFLKAELRGKIFIEYGPAEESIFPVEAPGYAMIQCFWVSGRYKGKGLGSKLYREMEEDCRRQGYKGIVAVSSAKKKPFMVDKKVLAHYGFQCCDQADPWYELLVKPFDKETLEPRFWDSARRGRLEASEGLVFMYSGACPFNRDFAGLMADIARKRDIPVKEILLETREDLKQLPTPWGIFSAFWKGEFLSAEVMTQGRFEKLLDSLQ